MTGIMLAGLIKFEFNLTKLRKFKSMRSYGICL